MFGLAAVAAIAVMAFVGASSAMATGSTSFCKVNEEPCAEANRVKVVHMVASDPLLLTSITNILCESSLAVVEVESAGLLANPLAAKVTELTWTNCKTVGHATNNCTVTNLKLPLFDVLREKVGLGSANALGAEVLVFCEEVPLVSEIHCTYGGPEVPGFAVESALHQVGSGHGMFTATKLRVPEVGNKFLCPNESFWDALYEPLEHLYLST